MTIYSEEFIDRHKCYGTFENDSLVGMIAARNNDRHIAMSFVDEKSKVKV